MPIVAAYPQALASFSTKYDFTDVVFAAHINLLQVEVAAIQAVLDTNPQGASSTVKARLTSIEAALNTVSSYFDGSGHLPESSVTGLVADLAALNTAVGQRLLASQNLSDVANIATARNNLGAAAVSHAHSYAAPTHTHAETDVTGLATDLAGKAAATHGHTNYVDVTTPQTVAGIKTFSDGILGAAGGMRMTGDIGTGGGTRTVAASYRAGAPSSSSGPTIDFTLTAPPSGKIVLLLFAKIGTGGTGDGYFSCRIRLDPNGTIAADFDDNHAVIQKSNASGPVSGATVRIIGGLTAGAVYRVEAGFKSSNADCYFDNYGVVALPSM